MKSKIVFIILGIIVLFIVFEAAWLYYYIQVGKKVAERSEKFERINAEATMRILVIGDSTAYGVGATDPKNSIAGRYAQRYPDAEVINMGVNGKKTIDLVGDLGALQDEQFDLLQLHIGGNDIIRFRTYKETEENIQKVLQLASKIADNVVFVSTGNLGTVKLFPPGTRHLLERRTRVLREIFITTSNQFDNVFYVDLFREKEEDPFSIDPEKYYAEDFLHLSDEGYADWFELISVELEKIESK